MSLSFFELNFEDLEKYFSDRNMSPKYASSLFNWHYKKNRRDFYDHQDLSKTARHAYRRDFNFDLPEIGNFELSEDKTVKFLMKLADGKSIESVLIPFQNKYTICVSSQVGCGMNCSFCFTGKQGFSRHLSVAEIVGQFLQVKDWLQQHRPQDSRILNVVFMGQGEPLHNFDHVKKACEIFLSQHGLSLASHKITVSTSGYLPGLERWKTEMPDINIALSLHSSFNEKRNQIIPINQKYPLEKIIPLVESIPTEEKRFVTYEYLLLGGFNDGEEDAEAVVNLLRGTKAFINLIPFNEFPGADFKRPSDAVVERFKDLVSRAGVPVTVRKTKGDQILAACGQLNTKNRNII